MEIKKKCESNKTNLVWLAAKTLSTIKLTVNCAISKGVWRSNNKGLHAHTLCMHNSKATFYMLQLFLHNLNVSESQHQYAGSRRVHATRI